MYFQLLLFSMLWMEEEFMRRTVRLMVKRYYQVSFRYLVSIIHKDVEIEEDVNHRIKA